MRRSPGLRKTPRSAAADSAKCPRSVPIARESHCLTECGRAGKISALTPVLLVSLPRGARGNSKEDFEMSDEQTHENEDVEAHGMQKGGLQKGGLQKGFNDDSGDDV